MEQWHRYIPEALVCIFILFCSNHLYKRKITGWEKQCGYIEDEDLTQASRMTRRRGREAPYQIKHSSGKQHQAPLFQSIFQIKCYL